MEHVVFYPAQDGSPAFRRLDNLEEAVRLVEHLRNVEGVGEASVHSLTEVALSFRAYYRVEVPGLTGLVPELAPVAETAPEVPVEEPVEVLVPALEDVEPPQPEAEVVVPEPAAEIVQVEPEPFESFETAYEPQPVVVPVPEQPTVADHDSEPVLVAVGAAEPEADVPAPTGSPFSTDRSLGFFA